MQIYYEALEVDEHLAETMLVKRNGVLETYIRTAGKDWVRGPNAPENYIDSRVDSLITEEEAADRGFVLSDHEASEPLTITAEMQEMAKNVTKIKTAPGKTVLPSPVVAKAKTSQSGGWNIAVILGAAMGVYLAMDA